MPVITARIGIAVLIISCAGRAFGQAGPPDSSDRRPIRVADVWSVSQANAEPAPGQSSADMTSAQGPRVGIAVKVSSLGYGLDVAVPIVERANVRGGINMFTYTHDFDERGIDYTGELKLRSANVFLDWFPAGGGFHLSPGVVFYNDNALAVTASASVGQRVSIGDREYLATSLGGNGLVDFDRVSPALLLGWGNLVPRGRRRWSVPFELGVVYQGAPRVGLNLTGTVCDLSGANCRNVAADPIVQADVLAEQTSLSNDLSFFKFYPVISIGFSYRFGG